VLLRHMPAFVPGAPTMIVNNMPGAGGVKAANYVANVAPKDGTALLVPLKPVAMTQLLRKSGIKYDASKFNWVGSMVDAPGALTVWHGAPAKSLLDVRKTELAMASSGVGGETFIFPIVINSVLGTRFKVITGYKGMTNMLLAVERGEVHGVSTVYGSLKGLKPEWLAGGKVRFLAQVTEKRTADLPDVPTVLEFAKTDGEREILRFLTLSNVIGRSVTAPQGIPADRLAALRGAFDATVKAPGYLAEAKKRGMLLNPTPGAEVQKSVNALIATPKATVEKVKAALAAGVPSKKK
jgi:tripartite-type tricarboxylate transporter receptor subunit TctC